MIKNNYYEKMEDVYHHAYKNYYKYEEEYILESLGFIKKNIKEHGLNIKDLKDFNILNIGTGRESIAFQRLGAKHTFHIDISSKAVSSLGEYINNNDINNISTFQMDICKDNIQEIIGQVEINYVYMDGIFHHLHNSNKALENIFQIAGKPCYIFMRNYLSGRWLWFIVEIIRRIIQSSDNDLVPLLYLSIKRFKKASPQRYDIYRELYDDFFVPTINLHRPADIDNYFRINGFTINNPRIIEEYNHNYKGAGTEAISLYYSRLKSNPKLNDSNTVLELIPVDQINDIKYKEQYILDNIDKIKRLINKDYFESSINRSILCISLYRLAREICNEDNIKKSSEERHAELAELFDNFDKNCSMDFPAID